jgi:MFS family permease
LENYNLTDQEKIRALPWFLGHVALTSIFFNWTFGGSVFLLFLSELGLPKGLIGLMLSFFPFAGLTALLTAPYSTRIGRKKVFLACFGSRYFVIINLVFLPWIMRQFGQAVGVAFTFAIIIVVALLRATGESSYFPWSQEFIPNSVRGWYSAVATSLSAVVTAIALLIAGRVIDAGAGIGRFLWLLGIGSLIGFVGLTLMGKVPGGAPVRGQSKSESHLANMRAALRNPNMSAYIMGVGGISLGFVLMTSFLPLYLKEQMSLSAGTVVTIDMVVMIGGALSSIVSGWAADRVGSRPVLMANLAVGLILPVCWFFLPRQVPNAATWCSLLYFIYGIISNGASIGAGRLLFNRVIPPEKNTSYTAIYYAWIGLMGGIAPLLAGSLLTLLAGFSSHIGVVNIDGQSILFCLSFGLMGFGLYGYGRVAPDGSYTTRAVLHALWDRIPFRRPSSIP